MKKHFDTLRLAQVGLCPNFCRTGLGAEVAEPRSFQHESPMATGVRLMRRSGAKVLNVKCVGALTVVAAVLGLAGCSSSAGGGGGTQPKPIMIAFQSAPPTSLTIGAAPVSITALVTNDTASRGVDWLLTCSATQGAAPCGTLSSPCMAPSSGTSWTCHTDSGTPVIYTPPTSIPGSSETVNIVAFASSDHSSNVPATVTVMGLNGSLSGTYVFETLGTFGGAAAVTGVLVADGNGNITGGEIFSPATGTTTPVPVSNGSYNLGAGGVGALSANATTPGGSVLTLSFGLAVLSSSRALLSEVADSGLTSGVGTMDLQASAAPPTGSFAFVVSGQVSNDPSFSVAYNQPVAFGGIFTIDSANVITGVADENLNGMVTTSVALSGSVVPLDSMGAVTVNLNAAFPAPPAPPGLVSPPIQLTGFVVDSQHIKLAGAPDPTTFLGFSVGGSAIGQGSGAGTFKTNASLSGPFAFGVLGQSQTIADASQPVAAPAVWASAAWAGLFSADGAGHLASGYADQEVGFGIPAITDTLTGTYSADPSGSGRVSATTTFGSAGPGPSFEFYLTGPGGPVLVLETDQAPGGGVISGGVGAGIAHPQATAAPTFNGAYGVTLTANNFGSEADYSDAISVDGTAGTIADDNMTLSGTFTPSANGVFPGMLTVNGTASGGDFYIADPTQGFFIENDGLQVSLGYFAAQTLPAAAKVKHSRAQRLGVAPVRRTTPVRRTSGRRTR